MIWGAILIDTKIAYALKLELCTNLSLCQTGLQLTIFKHRQSCLLYTSDAADDLLCVDLGGRRIIKKKKKKHIKKKYK